jgi:hypothetical protein
MAASSLPCSDCRCASAAVNHRCFRTEFSRPDALPCRSRLALLGMGASVQMGLHWAKYDLGPTGMGFIILVLGLRATANIRSVLSTPFTPGDTEGHGVHLFDRHRDAVGQHGPPQRHQSWYYIASCCEREIRAAGQSRPRSFPAPSMPSALVRNHARYREENE